MPVGQALAVTRERYQALAEGPVEEAAVRHIEGLLMGMAGELDEGLRLIRAARETFAEFGIRLLAVGTARDEGLIARYRGDAAEIEDVLRPATDDLRAAGETGLLSTQIAELAECFYELGRYDDAATAVAESERMAQPSDVASQVTWRRVRAKVLARQGETKEARRVAADAIERASATNFPEMVGDAWLDLAEVERIAGRQGGVREALGRALAAYEQKGLVPMAARARRELDALGPLS
jgi:tetratricopeptide (TPR) repeat protein